jgi:hypothetical protein
MFSLFVILISGCGALVLSDVLSQARPPESNRPKSRVA